MRRKHYLYHVTTPECAKKILQEGLKRQNKPWVYMSERPTSWWQPGLDVLRIHITGLKEDMRTFLPELDEILYFGDINSERINRADDAIPRRYVQMMCRKYGDQLSISRGHENGSANMRETEPQKCDNCKHGCHWDGVVICDRDGQRHERNETCKEG